MSLRERLLKTFKEKEFNKWYMRAKVYTENKEKAKGLVRRAIILATKKKGRHLADIWDKLLLSFELVRDWANGSYKVIPKTSIALVIIGLVYFVSPADIMPDILAPLGFFDDATILAFIFRQIGRDLEAYSAWKGYKLKEEEKDMESSIKSKVQDVTSFEEVEAMLTNLES